MIELGVNIDHVATVREARKTYEPDPVWAAAQAQLGGADGITVHLREDRRHIQDRDVYTLKKTVTCKLNLEMALAEPIIEIALDILPEQATLVPEKREEVTTEGGLDLNRVRDTAENTVARLKDAGIKVAAFIDPEPQQISLAKTLGFDAVELHTGTYANVETENELVDELAKLIHAGQLAVESDLALHAGHGLNYLNTAAVAGINQMRELNIGHAIISRSIFVGLTEAVREMKQLMLNATR